MLSKWITLNYIQILNVQITANFEMRETVRPCNGTYGRDLELRFKTRRTYIPYSAFGGDMPQKFNRPKSVASLAGINPFGNITTIITLSRMDYIFHLASGGAICLLSKKNILLIDLTHHGKGWWCVTKSFNFIYRLDVTGCREWKQWIQTLILIWIPLELCSGEL